MQETEQKAAKEKPQAHHRPVVPPVDDAAPSTDSAPEHIEAEPVVSPADTRPAEPPAKPRMELIKNEDRPREPSKKLPDIFYDD
jgi:hypothetical protein